MEPTTNILNLYQEALKKLYLDDLEKKKKILKAIHFPNAEYNDEMQLEPTEIEDVIQFISQNRSCCIFCFIVGRLRSSRIISGADQHAYSTRQKSQVSCFQSRR